MENKYDYKQLDVYKEAKSLVLMVYALLKKFPKEEQYAMCDQLRRASVSVVSNIAEGTSRVAIKEKIHFLDIAYGSLMETYSQMDVAVDLGYLQKEDLSVVKRKGLEVTKLLAGLKKSYQESSCEDSKN